MPPPPRTKGSSTAPGRRKNRIQREAAIPNSALFSSYRCVCVLFYRHYFSDFTAVLLLLFCCAGPSCEYSACWCWYRVYVLYGLVHSYSPAVIHLPTMLPHSLLRAFAAKQLNFFREVCALAAGQVAAAPSSVARWRVGPPDLLSPATLPLSRCTSSPLALAPHPGSRQPPYCHDLPSRTPHFCP
jgi:hypothetical protein